ncbi:MAG TPA: xanthine dehydrogenase family protein subunit M, partial [Blastocatellia bacterium]|nr:xanthine dehydrogenase family protein subunit M [Blastocatellia bacterium]
PTNFEYYAPKTVDEAIGLLAEHGDESKVLAGGHSLIPAMKLRLTQIPVLVDIGRISDLSYIKVDGGTIRIGAMTTHGAVAASDEIKQHCPLLAECGAQVGDQQVRNRGTMGGSLVHADPAADWPAAILALNAELVLKSANGERVVNAADFFVDMLTTDVQPGELLTEIRVPIPAQPQASAYLKVPQAASGFAVVGVAAQLEMDGNTCKAVSIGVTGLAPKAYRASSVEAALVGATLDDAAVSAAAAKADADASDAMGDIHASEDYRRHLARVYAKRAVQTAAGRA